jgi:hypothetical protein
LDFSILAEIWNFSEMQRESSLPSEGKEGKRRDVL